MYFNTEIFIDIIVLLVSNGNPLIKKIINDFIKIYESENTNEVSVGINEYTKFYVTVIKDLLKMDLTEKEFKIYLAKIKCGEFIKTHLDVFDTLKIILTKEHNISDIQKNSLLHKVENFILWYECYKNMRTGFAILSPFTTTSDDEKREAILENFKSIINQTADQFHIIRSVRDVPTNIIDFTNKDSIKRGYKKHKQNKIVGTFKLGWQGANRLFGERGGISRGESVVFCALSHNCKSTMLMNCARWIVNYNTPIVDPGAGQATVLFISLENEASENMIMMYRQVYEMLTQSSGIDRSDEEVIEFIYEYFNRRGWKLIIERRVGSDFGEDELKALYEDYTKRGHCILVTIIDYLHKMKKKVQGKESSGHIALQTLYENVVNYLGFKGSTLITAHQLNRDAAKLASSGINNVVRKFNTEHLQDGEAPFKVPDVVIFLHIETNTYGVSYLTMSIRKHRYVNNTPERHKNTAYRFTPHGIFDDLEGKDNSVRDIYADNFENPDGSMPDIEQEETSTGKELEAVLF